MNFSLPLLHVVIALLNPGMAWLRVRGRTAGLARPARRLFWLVLVATSLYGVALYGLREPLFRIAYGGHVRPEPLPALLVAVFVPLQILLVTLSSFAKARGNLRLVRRATYATCPVLLVALCASDGFGSVASIFAVADLMLLLMIACTLPALSSDTERAATIQQGGLLLAAAPDEAQPSQGGGQATPAPQKTECDNCHGAPAHIRIVSPAPDGRGPP